MNYLSKHTDQHAVERAKERLKDVRMSHIRIGQIKEGWQSGMYEKEVSNYDGFGPLIRVYGRTPAETEALAMLVVASLKGKTVVPTVRGMEIL